MNLNIVRIEINKEEAESFKIFRKQQDNFLALCNIGLFDSRTTGCINILDDLRIMVESGLFGFKNGAGTIFRDDQGVLKNIEIKSQTFLRKKMK